MLQKAAAAFRVGGVMQAQREEHYLKWVFSPSVHTDMHFVQS